MTTCPRPLASLGFVVLAAWLGGLTQSPGVAEASRMRRPFNVSVGVNYGRDNYGGTGCDDYRCGGYCYDGHSGTDFPLGLGTTVVAAFAGRVTATYNGCANYGGLGNTCGGRCGNYVRIQHADGSATLYCHLQLNSISVSTGQYLSCGQAVGRSASSGNSSGPHLHLGYYIGGATRDPFSGPCSQGTSYWVSQGTYPHPIPSTACETNCACNPGQTQTEGCGNCGTRSRTCGSNCQWGAWSGCGGQGPCSPGQVESRACCDCGTESRTCQGSCQWSGWGGCSGPDPVGAADCDTGEPGVCAAGRQRCVEGCLACARLVEPSPERCDELDNDCSGVVDDGSPEELGDPPPALAARLVDLSVPRRLAPGERATGWAVFENVGGEPWRAGELWLQALAPGQGTRSLLQDSQTWLAHDVAGVLEHDVEPGGFAEVTFGLQLAPGVREAVVERFRLLGPTGEPIRCPVSELEVAIAPARATAAEVPRSPDLAPTAASPGSVSPTVLGGCQCQAPGPALPGTGAPLGGLLVLTWLGLRRRRVHRRRGGERREVARGGRGKILRGEVLLRSLLPLLAVLAAGCVEEEPPSGRVERAAVDRSGPGTPSLAPAGALDSPVAAAHGRLTAGETLLDASAAGDRVVGRRRAAPPRSSAWLTYEARLVTARGAAVALPVPEGIVQEARFAPGPDPVVALLDRQERLWVWRPGRGAPALVDHPVLPGLAWSPDGASLAYAQGAVPELTLRRYDLGPARHTTLVPAGPPLALPAWSPDGAHLVFASARDGVPALYRLRADGTGLHRLTNRTLSPAAFQAGALGLPMPEGSRPPLWQGDLVIIEAAGDVLAVDAAEGTLRWRLAGADWLHRGRAGVVVRRGGSRGTFQRVLLP